MRFDRTAVDRPRRAPIDVRALGVTHPGPGVRQPVAGRPRRARRPPRRGRPHRRRGPRRLHRQPHRPVARRTSSSSARPAVADQIDWAASTSRWSRPRSTACATWSAAYLQNRDLFVFDGYACADPRLPPAAPRRHREGVARPVRPLPVPAARRRRNSPASRPDWTVLHAADFHADPARDGTAVGGRHRPSTSSSSWSSSAARTTPARSRRRSSPS